jgi:hypothetical protein
VLNEVVKSWLAATTVSDAFSASSSRALASSVAVQVPYTVL